MKIKTENEVTLQFPSQSSNEGFIRSAVAVSYTHLVELMKGGRV